MGLGSSERAVRRAELDDVLDDLRAEMDRLRYGQAMQNPSAPVRQNQERESLRRANMGRLTASVPFDDGLRETFEAYRRGVEVGRAEAEAEERETVLLNDANPASPKTSNFERQGFLGNFLQAATWVFSSPHADSPGFMDNWLRCSTMSRSCTVGEVLRKCTYEPKVGMDGTRVELKKESAGCTIRGSD